MRGPNSAAAIDKAIRASHAALGGSRPIDLWQVHHVEPERTVEVMRAADKCREEGLIEQIGVCNVCIEQLESLRKANIKICSVQEEFSIWNRTASSKFNNNPRGKTGLLDYCIEHNLTFIAYSPFGGLKQRRKERDLVKDFPKFGVVSKKKGFDPYHLLLAVYRTLWPKMLIIVGTRTPERAAALLEYEKIELTKQEAEDLWKK